MATTGVLYLNDRDVGSDWSLNVAAINGFPGGLGGMTRDVALNEDAQAGPVLDPRRIRIRPKTAEIRGYIDAASVAAAITALDGLRALFAEGPVAVRSVYAPDRYCLAHLLSHDGVAVAPAVLNGQVEITLSLMVPDGVAFRLEPDGYALSTARTACPVGTAFSFPALTINGNGGSLTNPLVTLRDAGGQTVQTMGFTIVLAANDYLRVDSARGAIDKSVAGTVTDGMSLWTSGDFPIIRPGDASVEAGGYATVELTASAGTTKGGISYLRRYL
jgi:hypothetical protein